MWLINTFFKLAKKIDFQNYIHRSFSSVFLLNIFRILFQFLVGIILVRSLGASDYGIYAYIMTAINTLTLFSGLGLPNLSVREVAKFAGQKKWGMLKSYIVQLHKINLIVIGICFLALIGFLKLILARNVDVHTVKVAILGLTLFPFLSLGLLRSGILRGLKHPFLAQLPEYFVIPLTFIVLLVLGFLFFLRNYFNLTTVFLLQLLSVSLGTLLGLIFLVKKLPFNFFAINQKNVKIESVLQRALPFICLSGIGIINARMDILLLGFLRPASDVGIYKVVTLFAQVISITLMIYNTVSGPVIADMFYQSNKSELQKVVTLGTRITFFFTLIGVLILTIFGFWILKFFYGPLFSDKGYIPLVILLVSQLINVGFGAVGMILNMTNHEKITLRITLLSFIVNFVLNFALVPTFGINGSAVATAISVILWNVVLFVYVYKKVNVNSCITYRIKNFFESIR
jgi:O-antigen/teichoic acid export membrane protein